MRSLLRSPRVFTSVVGSALVIGSLLLVTGCGSSGSARQGAGSRTLQLTAIDSLSGAPLDSAHAVNRTFTDSMETHSGGQFTIRDAKPALYVFDVGGYGYHSQRHVSVLVEPSDTRISHETRLLPKRLSINCEDKKTDRPYFWDNVVEAYQNDTTAARMRLTDVFANDGEVRVQPVIVNDLSSPIFFPDNFGALGHYNVQLYDEDNNPVPFTHKDAPRDDGRRIYEKADIFPVVPKEAERLTESRLVLKDSVKDGTTLFARIKYTFSPSDTLRTTSATTFPELHLDSLQVPVFDTVRTAGEVIAPDSLVLQRDTTKMEVVGIDTTVTRRGYLLYSTLRDSNAAPTPQAAIDLLYVPDSVKARARRDSLEAIAETRTKVPRIDTTEKLAPDDRPRLHVVSNSDTSRLNSLVTDPDWADAITTGLPDRNLPTDSLVNVSETLRGAFFQQADLDTTIVRRGLDTKPDSLEDDGYILTAPASDSLFGLFRSDSLTTPDAWRSPYVGNPFVAPDPSERLAPDRDSITIDALPLSVGPDADSVVVDSVLSETFGNPPNKTSWFVPDSLTQWGSRVIAVDPAFFQLRLEPIVDTTAQVNVQGFPPKRIGKRKRLALHRYPQQVIRAPTGTYRPRYLNTWNQLQERQLQQHYCQIFPFPLRSQWRSTSMR